MATVTGEAQVILDGAQAGAQLEKLDKQARDIKAQLVELRKQPLIDSQKVKQLETALKGINNETKQLKLQTTNYKTVLANLSGASLNELKKAYKQLNIETSKLKRGTDEWKASAANLAKVKGEISKVKGEMNGAGTAAKGFGASMKNIASQMFAGGGIIAAVYAFVSIIKGAFNIFVDFGKASSKLQAIMGKTKDEMKALNDQAKLLGSTTAYTATQVIELQTELAKLGFSETEILASSDAVLSLAAATGTELAPAAELAGATLRIFNLDASEMTRVADVLAVSTTKSSLSMEKLATILPTVGKTAQIAGVSLEKTVALAGTLTDRGLDASSAATSLRNIFLELSNKGLTWNEAMTKINNSTDKNKTSMDLFGKRAAAAGVILAEQGISVENLTGSLENLDTTAKQMAETMLDNVAGDMTKAQSAWEGFILSIEDGNGRSSKFIRSIIQDFTDLLGAATKANDENLTFTQRLENAAESANKFNFISSQLRFIWNGITTTFSQAKQSIYELLNIEIEINKAQKAGNKTSKLRLTRLIEQKEAVKELTDEEKKALEQRLKANAQLRDMIDQINVELIQDEKQRSIAEVDLWRKKELQKVKESEAAASIKSQAVEAIEASHAQKLADIDQKYNDDLIKKYESINKFLEDNNAKLETDRQAILDREIQAISSSYDEKIRLAQDNVDLVLELEATKEDAIAAYKEQKELELSQKVQSIRKEYGLISDEEQFQADIDKLNQFYADELISLEDFEAARAQIINDYNQKEIDDEKKKQDEKLKLVRSSIQNQQAILGALSDFYQSAKDEELAAAGDNEEKKKEIAKRYADKEFAIKAGQIVASTALAIIEAFAQLGPIAGAISAAFLGVTGAIQLSNANKERQRIKGLESGGEFPVTRAQDGKKYNARYGGEKRGYFNHPTVLVGEENKREFVVSNRSLQNPLVQRAVSAIDDYQRSGSLKYFNYSKVNAAIGSIKGYADGGTIGTATTNQNTTIDNTEIVTLLMQLITNLDTYTSAVDTWQNELEVYVEYQKIKAAGDTLSALETNVKL